MSDVQTGKYLSEYTYTQNTGTGSTTSNVSASDTGRTEEDITITRGDEIEEYSKFLEAQTNIYTMWFIILWNYVNIRKGGIKYE